MRIGILGGTGPAGSEPRRPPGQHRLRRSSSARARSTGRWRLATRSARAVAGPRATACSTATTRAAADCDLVVIATPWDSAATHRPGARADALARQGRHLDGQRPRPGRPRVPAAGAARAARSPRTCRPRSRGCRVVAAFHHLPAKELGRPRRPDRLRRADLLVTTPRPSPSISEIVAKIPGCRPLDAGELSQRHRDRGVHGRAAPAQRALQARGSAPKSRPGIRCARRRRCGCDDTSAARRPRSSLRAARARADVHVRHHAVRRHPPRPRRDVPRLRRAAAAAARPRSRA